MSLAINSDQIIAVYALGQWHPVEQGTFYTDAYELIEDKTHFQLGELYHQSSSVEMFDDGHRFVTPSGMTGCSWQDPSSGDHVYVSILEVKGWKEA